MKKIIINLGDPAGIGPDLCVKLAYKKFDAALTVVGNKKAIKDRARILKKKISFTTNEMLHRGNSTLSIIDTKYPLPVVPGEPCKKNSIAQFKKIDFIISELLIKKYDSFVTLPIAKEFLSEYFPNFKGHTEYISALTKRNGQEVMMLASKNLRVALVTTHISLNKVARSITLKRLEQTVRTLQNDLEKKFKIINPKILITGLNPHAGENGNYGNEEQNIIIPTIKMLNLEGYNLTGPVSADTAFTKKNIQNYDAFLAMYHDQGLAPFKALSFGKGVNITLGLPFVRTSVDHGTAFDIAGTNEVDPSSFFEAIEMAIALS